MSTLRDLIDASTIDYAEQAIRLGAGINNNGDEWIDLDDARHDLLDDLLDDSDDGWDLITVANCPESHAEYVARVEAMLAKGDYIYRADDYLIVERIEYNEDGYATGVIEVLALVAQPNVWHLPGIEALLPVWVAIPHRGRPEIVTRAGVLKTPPVTEDGDSVFAGDHDFHQVAKIETLDDVRRAVGSFGTATVGEFGPQASVALAEYLRREAL